METKTNQLKNIPGLLKLFLLIFLIFTGTNSYSWTKSDSLKISILTCSPGEEMYTTFGHTAIRVIDYNQGLDIVFNYGTFDFDTPNFYGKFVKGKLPYQLSISEMDSFRRSYIDENRSIWEQEVNMSYEGKSRMFNFLKTNYMPENRYYLYDFFLKNCTSVVRDILKNNPENEECFNNTEVSTGLSFREHLKPLVKEKRWIDFGFDILLGYKSDKTTSKYESMFLPHILMNELDEIYCRGEKFVGETKTIYEAKKESPGASKIFGPVPVFWLLFIIIFLKTVFEFRKGNKSFLLDKIIFSIAGFLGILLTFLWFGTDHWTFSQNMDLLWAIPLHMPVILLVRKLNKNFIKYYFLVTAVLAGLIVLGWNIIPQDFHPAVVPVSLIVFVRAARIYLIR